VRIMVDDGTCQNVSSNLFEDVIYVECMSKEYCDVAVHCLVSCKDVLTNHRNIEPNMNHVVMSDVLESTQTSSSTVGENDCIFSNFVQQYSCAEKVDPRVCDDDDALKQNFQGLSSYHAHISRRTPTCEIDAAKSLFMKKGFELESKQDIKKVICYSDYCDILTTCQTNCKEIKNKHYLYYTNKEQERNKQILIKQNKLNKQSNSSERGQFLAFGIIIIILIFSLLSIAYLNSLLLSEHEESKSKGEYAMVPLVEVDEEEELEETQNLIENIHTENFPELTCFRQPF